MSISSLFHGENEEKTTATLRIFHHLEGFSDITSELLILSIWKEASPDSFPVVSNKSIYNT